MNGQNGELLFQSLEPGVVERLEDNLSQLSGNELILLLKEVKPTDGSADDLISLSSRDLAKLVTIQLKCRSVAFLRQRLERVLSSSVGLSILLGIFADLDSNPHGPLPMYGLRPQPHIHIVEHPRDNLNTFVGDEICLRFEVLSHSNECNPKNGCYKWYFKSKLIVEQDNSKYFMKGTTEIGDQGHYYCEFHCGCPGREVVVSNKAFISIAPKLTFQLDVPQFFATDKIALLIGNGIYENNTNLLCSSQDVHTLTSILKDDMNFKTLSFVNLNLSEMLKALTWFYDLCNRGCYCVFYFAGHGYASDAGKLYLLPTDAPPMTSIDEHSCIDMQLLAEDLQRRCEPALTVILPDTCRVRNAAAAQGRQSVPTVRCNVVFAYATVNQGQAYEQRENGHSVFVGALRRFLNEPRRVNDMLTCVGDEVGLQRYQIVEVCHTLHENRCLTDRIIPDRDYENREQRWRAMHETPLPIVFKFAGCEVVVKLDVVSELTNRLRLGVSLLEHGRADSCLVFINWLPLAETNRLHLTGPDGNMLSYDRRYQRIHVSCLQKLEVSEQLPVAVVLQYVLRDQPNMLHRKSCVYRLTPNDFVRQWRTSFARNSQLATQR